MLFLALFSCHEDHNPEKKITGTYESLLTGRSGGWIDKEFDFSDTFEFRSDGTFYQEDVTRTVGTDEVLGFRTVANGTYTISDGVVTLHYEDFYSMQIEDVPYLPKDQLTFSDMRDYVNPFGNIYQYRVLTNYTQLQYICPSNANCTSTLPVYTKID